MPKLFLAAILAAAFGAAVSGQTRSAIPRTPWGHPDLQGRWTNATITLVRAARRIRLEGILHRRRSRRVFQDGTRAVPRGDRLHGRSGAQRRVRAGVWVEERRIVSTRRTSLIVGPSGRVPAAHAGRQSPSGRTQRAAETESRRRTGSPDAERALPVVSGRWAAAHAQRRLQQQLPDRADTNPCRGLHRDGQDPFA